MFQLVVLAALALALVACRFRHRLPILAPRLALPQTSEPTVKSIPARPWGTWAPVHFTYPAVEPWTDFDVAATKPIPYRPFRWGPKYPINMGIRPMAWNDWLQLDSDYLKTLTVRRRRTVAQENDDGELATGTLAGYRPHALEGLTEMCSFLAARHPTLFKVTRAKYEAGNPETHGDSLVGDAGGAVRSIRNLITGEYWDFDELDRHNPEWNPMKVAGLIQQDDVAVMVEGEDGEYYLQAGSICTAGFWRLQDKLGQSLEGIHTPGAVPGWKDKLKFSMERFFQKMKVDKPFERNNYFFQIDDGLDWSVNTNGPEKIFDQASKAPRPELLASSTDPTWKAPAPTTNVDDIWYRSERQSMRRLPKTGGVLYTIRTYFHRVADIAMEPGVPGRMASAIRSWPDQVASYKGKDLYASILLPYLDDLHKRQLELGTALVDAVDGDSATYPF